jgi:hypothetical protein
MQFSEMPNMSEPNPEYAQQQAAAKVSPTFTVFS